MSTVTGRWCRLLGCRWHFTVEGNELVWACGRCGCGGSRTYEDPRSARRMLAAVDRGAPRPPVGFLAALGGTVGPRPGADGDRSAG